MRETVGPYTKPSLREERKDGKEYYEDNYNDLPWKCSFGTRQDDGIWLNLNDPPGLTMSSMVWLLIGTFQNPLQMQYNTMQYHHDTIPS